jgi:predicted nucleotidyltransferase
LSDEREAVSKTVTTVAEAPVLEKLPPRVREALGAFQQALLAAFPGQIRRIILYGSFARGEAAPDSDVDVMVVVGWEEERLPDGLYRSMYGDPRWQTIVDAAHDVSLEHGVWMSPYVVGENRYVARQRWSFFKEVQREGSVLWPNSS